MRLEVKLLAIWAYCVGVALWMPAIGLQFAFIFLQPMDVLVLLGLPFLFLFWRTLPVVSVSIVALGIISALLSFRADGAALVLIYYLALISPFLLLLAIVALQDAPTKLFFNGFLTGFSTSVILNAVQLVFGAEHFDFRNNLAFELPPQFGRAFSVFPEVSTYAVHTIIGITVCYLGLARNVRTRFHPVLIGSIILLAVVTLAFSRSASVFVILPLLAGSALLRLRNSDHGKFGIILIAVVLGLVGTTTISKSLFAARLENASVERSISMRAASMVAGISPLINGELTGVGLGNNHEITRRAYDVAKRFDLSFGSLPDGVNSLIIARIFEEGWPSFVQFLFAGILLFRVVTRPSGSTYYELLVILAVGSFLSSMLVIGYRGIYLNWIWLALAGVLWQRPSKSTH